MSLTSRVVDEVAILDLASVLTEVSGAEVLSHLDRDVPARRFWAFNLAAVTYIDSAGLGALVYAHRHLESRGGALKVFNIQPRSQHLLDITGLAGIIQTFDSEADVLSSVRAARAAEGATS